MNQFVYIVGGDDLVERMFFSRSYTLTYDLQKADVVVFTGGADVTPSFYGSEPHPTTYNDKFRDATEEKVFLGSSHTLRIGICRGSQFLCVMNGGVLYQDVDNHCRPHSLIYTDETGLDTVCRVTSTHHQMMYPRSHKPHGNPFELWGFASEATHRDFGRGLNRPTDHTEGPDVEIVFWPETSSLGFQPHPEYGLESCEALFFMCLNRALSRKDSVCVV